MLSLTNQRWLDEFMAKHKRAPRILHIGNIANNAYNNAKIMRQAGLESDVVCYDYYHIMACPEWEDADFDQGKYGDDFTPNWHEVNLKKFERPQWFVQGPLKDCQDYLLAKHANNQLEKDNIWGKLLLHNRILKQSGYNYYWGKTKDLWIVRTLKFQLSWLKRFIYQVYLQTDHLGRVLSQSNTNIGQFSGLLLGSVSSGIGGIYKSYSICKISVKRYVIDVLSGTQTNKNELELQEQFFKARTRMLTNKFSNEFPDRLNRLSQHEMAFYKYTIAKWRMVLDHYDIVIGYATLSIIPHLCDKTCFAFEHGTLRDIPYADDTQGKLTALSYRLAMHVFVTNFDCVKSAQFLAPNRFTIINHPYDEDHGENITGDEELRKSLMRELASEFILFHPTRQDWVEGKGFADKKNDVLIKAFIALRTAGHKIGLLCCNWGQNVRQTQTLLSQSGCSPYVKWISPLAITPFERMCLASDIVVDQFKLGAFGGILFKALSVGAPVLTYLDEKAVLEQYPECPPVINCRTEAELVDHLEQLIQRPEVLKELGAKGRSWIRKYHSKITTLNKQVDQFRRYCKPFT